MARGALAEITARLTLGRCQTVTLRDCNYALSRATVFSVVDCAKAYTQIPVAEEDLPKTAIITSFGLFESLFLPFGLRNAAQTWQRFIDSVLRGLSFCFAYLDDILFFSSMAEQRQQHLTEVFKRLDQYGIVLNTTKCIFGRPEITFLGHLVSPAGSLPLPEKVGAILKISRPETAKELRRFLGMLTFYRRHLPHSAELQEPLTAALSGSKTKRNTPLQWTDVISAAFGAAKHSIANAALLAHPSLNSPLALVVDACQTAIGAALQQHVDSAWQPLAFYSHKLSPSRQKWGAYDRELLAVYEAIKYFRPHLEGRESMIFTDHKPLIYAFRLKNDNTII